MDKDLKKLGRLQASVREVGRTMAPVSLAGLFLLLVGFATAGVVGFGSAWVVLVGSAMIGAYMALNIGANDVAKAITGLRGLERVAKQRAKRRRRYLVRRTHVIAIISAWLITVPVSATIAAVLAWALYRVGPPGME